MNFEHQFKEWITLLNKAENPSTEITAFNFGLFQTEAGYCMYLTGSKRFDAEDDDWAVEVDFEPKEKYLEIDPPFSKELTWDKVLDIAVIVIKSYVGSVEFENSILGRAEAVTTGFDDGELIRIK